MKTNVLLRIRQRIERHLFHNFKSKDIRLVFISDTELAETANFSKWINTSCGHDCCTCDVECK